MRSVSASARRWGSIEVTLETETSVQVSWSFTLQIAMCVSVHTPVTLIYHLMGKKNL